MNNKALQKNSTAKSLKTLIGNSQLIKRGLLDITQLSKDRISDRILTGFKDIDKVLGGLQNGDLITLAGRPGIGKTALALNIATFVTVNHKIPVFFISPDMSKEELVDRLLVSVGDIDAWKLITGKLDEQDFSQLSEAMEELSEAPLFFDDKPKMSIMEISTEIRRCQAEHEIKLIIIDDVQLQYSDRINEKFGVSITLKKLAQELNIPIIILYQLLPSFEMRGTPKPQLGDLPDIEKIRETADIILFLYYLNLSNLEWLGAHNIFIAKNHNKLATTLHLRFNSDKLKFYSK